MSFWTRAEPKSIFFHLLDESNSPELSPGNTRSLEGGHSRGFDGDAPFLLVLAGVGEPGLPGACRGDDAGLAHQGIRQRGFAVVHVGDHGHVPDVGLFVHDGPYLVYCEVHLEGGDKGDSVCTETALAIPRNPNLP